MWLQEMNEISGITTQLKEVSLQLEGSAIKSQAVLPQSEHVGMNNLMFHKGAQLEQAWEKLGDQPPNERELLKLIDPVFVNFPPDEKDDKDQANNLSELSQERLQYLSDFIKTKRGKQLNGRIDAILKPKLQETANELWNTKQKYKDQLAN